jgi:hypothetical protein
VDHPATRPGGDSQGWRSRWRPLDFEGERWLQVDLAETRSLDAVERRADGTRVEVGAGEYAFLVA